MKTGSHICWHTYTLKVLWELSVAFRLYLSATPALFLSCLLLSAAFKKANVNLPFITSQSYLLNDSCQ